MKTLHLYITRQILGTLVMTVLVFTFVLLLVNMMRDVISLLINGQVGLWIIAKAIGLMIPFVLVFALPMGMLTATLLTFGRFSADNELTAVRASGVSLVSLVTPVLILSVVLSGVAALINLHLSPMCRDAYKRLILSVTVENPSALLREKQYITGIPGGYGVYIDRRKGDELLDVEVTQVDETGTLVRWLRAPTGRLVTDPESKQMMLRLFDSRGAGQDKGEWNGVITGEVNLPLEMKSSANKIQATKLSDMSFSQLRAKVRELEQINLQQPSPDKLPPELRDQLKKSKTLDFALPAKVQLNSKISFSFACIGFALVGIPLGIRGNRKETSIGIAFALGLVIVYWSFLILGSALETRAELFPQFIVWLPTFIFQGVGAALLWRANKGLS